MKAAVTLGCLLILIFTGWRLAAQGYSVDWYKIAGGGGTSTNGNYQISGTIGQPDASGALIGGSYSVTGGFWSVLNLVQTAGAPKLLISASGNSVTVFWKTSGNWNLQANADLKNPSGWATISNGGSPINGTNFVTIGISGGNRFFRLQQ